MNPAPYLIILKYLEEDKSLKFMILANLKQEESLIL
jgi:hypothetical protein